MRNLWESAYQEAISCGPRPQDRTDPRTLVFQMQPSASGEWEGGPSAALEGCQLPDETASRIAGLESSIEKIYTILEETIDQLNEQGVTIE